MATIQELESKRDAVLQQMRSIRCMKRGSINEQYLKVHHRGIREPIARGPYYVLSRHEPRTGKTVSRRLTSKEDVEKARTDIAAYQHFVALCREFQELTEMLGELEVSLPGAGAEKKRRRLSSNKMPR
jgi:hypothetical protein